jgi:hypothetical protein
MRRKQFKPKSELFDFTTHYALCVTYSKTKVTNNKKRTYCVVCYFVDMLIEISQVCLPHVHQNLNQESRILQYQNALSDEHVNTHHLQPVEIVLLVKYISVSNTFGVKLQYF